LYQKNDQPFLIDAKKLLFHKESIMGTRFKKL